MDNNNNMCDGVCNMTPGGTDSSREKLLRELMEYDFVEYELVLYLDTHPHDMKALEMHGAVAKKAMELREEYEKKYGPITTKGVKPGNSWAWIESPWPWEN